MQRSKKWKRQTASKDRFPTMFSRGSGGAVSCGRDRARRFIEGRLGRKLVAGTVATDTPGQWVFLELKDPPK